MTPLRTLADRYGGILERFSDCPDENLLLEVQELAWELLADHLPLEDIGELHEKGLRATHAANPDLTFEDAVRLSPVLMELLVVYGMGLRKQAEEHARRELLEEHNQQLQSLLEELERSNKDLEEFAYVTSHDLQAPLRHVKDYLRLIAQGASTVLSEKDLDFMKRAMQETDRMQEMIRGILGYSRIATDESEPVDLSVCAQQAVDALKPEIDSSRAVVSMATLPVVEGQPIRLTQLFRNLLENALKYRSDRAPVIEIGAQDLGQAWRITVADNGIGMNPRLAPSVFKLFSRLNTGRKVPGTGIGLSHCRRIVQAHGGTMGVETTLGSGSTFHFTLPKTEHPLAEGATGRSLRVLIIDDDEDDRTLLRAALESADPPAEVHDAPDGPSGIATFGDYVFDCVLVDYGLPGMEGPAILRELKKLGPAPVVAMSGDPGSDWAQEMSSLGASRILSKHDMLAADAVVDTVAQAVFAASTEHDPWLDPS